jgi:hypothetical protein
LAWGINFSIGKQPIAVDTDKQGNIFYKMFSTLVSWLQHDNDDQKLLMVLQNPAALFIFSLQCDLTSLGKFYVKDENDEIIEDDPVLKLLNNPNPMQSGKQFIWDYMFWNMLGTANMYVDSKTPDEENKMYWLINHNIDWPKELKDKRTNIILSKGQLAEIQRTVISYRQENGKSFKFQYKNLLQFFDLSNGVGSWFESPSRLDALYKIVSNSDKALNTKGVNLDFISKFFVAGKIDAENTSQQMMGENDKKSIRESMTSDETVYPVKTMIDVKRFVDNYGVLEALGKSFLDDYFLMGKAFGIPRDVLEAYVSSTFENQEKARASHISYTISPKIDDFCSKLERHFGYIEQKKKIVCGYDHLPFVQAFEKERAEGRRANAQALVGLVNSGAEPQEAADYLGIEVNMTKERLNGAQVTGNSEES